MVKHSEIIKQMIDSKVHMGHKVKYSHFSTKQYIQQVRNDVQVINIKHTYSMMLRAINLLKGMAAKRSSFLIVGTKGSIRDIVPEFAANLGCPYVNKRWIGGVLTNNFYIQKTIKDYKELQRQLESEDSDLNKKELSRAKLKLAKYEKGLGGLLKFNTMPSALIIIDPKYEATAAREAKVMKIPTIGILDTNSDMLSVDFPILANDDHPASVSFFLKKFVDAVTVESSAPQAESSTPQVENEVSQNESISNTSTSSNMTKDNTKVKLIKSLRTETQVGISKCKEALDETGYDYIKAKEILVTRYADDIAKSKQSREVKEGHIFYKISAGHLHIVKVNCETDFVAKGEPIKKLGQKLANLAPTVSTLQELCAASESSVKEAVLVTGENIQVSSLDKVPAKEGLTHVYLHNRNILGAVCLEQVNAELGKSLAIQVVHSLPKYLSQEDFPYEEKVPRLASVKDQCDAILATATTKEEKKAANDKIKMIREGVVMKLYKDFCLLQQAYYKDTSKSVEEVLSENNNKINHFIRVEI